MNMHKQHPQRCLHSHICKFNGNNYQDCINTDCASHRYTYNFQSEREKVLDLITTFRKEQSKELKIHDMWVAEAEYLKELRQVGSP